jgi:hypothetical protein
VDARHKAGHNGGVRCKLRGKNLIDLHPNRLDHLLADLGLRLDEGAELVVDGFNVPGTAVQPAP